LVDIATRGRPDLSIIAPDRCPARMPGTGPLRRSSTPVREKAIVDKSRIGPGCLRSPRSVCDLSGLSGTKELISGVTHLVWQKVNSDEMTPKHEPVTSAPAKNLPIYRGVRQKAEDHLEDILHGFSDLHAFLISHKQSFLNYVDHYSSTRGRVIFRSTAVYARLIKESLHPSAIVSGVKRSLGAVEIWVTLRSSLFWPTFSINAKKKVASS
jgi:lantibiotic modifying enzyme